MSYSQISAATLPKGFRYETPGPKTPEPCAPGHETTLPSPPRPRFRLKKRHASHLNAPTQQFLASVAAADVPIPSVEEPDIVTEDQDMMDTLPELQIQDLDGMEIYHRLRPRTFSPPKTPATEIAAPHSPMKYPDWSIDSAWSNSDLESSPEYESSRPSTAFSTQTSTSLFSHYSVTSDDASCISPDLESADFLKPDLLVHAVGRKEPRKAPWTQAMNTHLWATYMLYLQDPKVTPVRLGKSCIPPNGVCLRVAREAKRSWKGSKSQPAVDPKSGSSTPTAESSKPYIEWPHTCAATRAHLRELCKLKASSKAGRYMSRSPTPFNKAAHRRWNRRSTPARSPSVFSAQDMAMSLTLSTSDTMQPHGPLAQLTNSDVEPFPELIVDPEPALAENTTEFSRLGSPFGAKSYGPSSSCSLAASIKLPRQSNTMGPRKLLKSPVRLTRSRSGTQKRRTFKSGEDHPRKRPSLSAAFYRESSQNVEERASIPRDMKHVKSSSTSFIQGANIFGSRPPWDESPAVSASQPPESDPFVVSAAPPSLTPPIRPARLGSPFSGSSSSHSFPNRLSGPINLNLTALRRPFATVQQGATQAIPETAAGPRSSLASRLAYLDQRLKELRSRGSERRRSQSPF
ncbi:hypothetical protein F4778DRAFT_432348 [Xylariomycetidae sp. FL2044]|nr:hypothetical protein F4778DRAFT_432348 [Xylariomycetidae sp. FL2044]